MQDVLQQFSFYGSQFFFVLGGIGNLQIQIFRSLFREKIEWSLVSDQIHQVGILSMSLILVTAISTGMVMAMQFGLGLEKFGGKQYVPKIVSLSIVRELGPAFTSLVVAGRVGAGFASEIGSMVVTQQIDAIRALGTSPLQKIIVPRFLALLIALPIVTAFATLAGIWSSMLIGMVELGLDPLFYNRKVVDTIILSDVILGTIKPILFAMLIATTSCYFGLNVGAGTRGVGIATTKAVVTSSILLFIFNFIITKVFWIVLRWK